ETGKALWSRPLQEDTFKGEKPKQNFFGVSVAPRIEGKAILLNLGDERTGCVTEIDKETGKTLWQSGQDGASFSTATCGTVGGARVAFFLTREGGLCCNVADGSI